MCATNDQFLPIPVVVMEAICQQFFTNVFCSYSFEEWSIVFVCFDWSVQSTDNFDEQNPWLWYFDAGSDQKSFFAFLKCTVP